MIFLASRLGVTGTDVTIFRVTQRTDAESSEIMGSGGLVHTSGLPRGVSASAIYCVSQEAIL